MRRVIAHIDIDAFYASVELMRRPELRGKPVIVSGDGPRAVVTTASYEARRYGVGSAMPTARALRLCPQAIVIPPDFAAYRTMSERVWSTVREQLACLAERAELERLGLDEAYLDLSATIAPKALMRRIALEVRARTGLTASVGIGPNKLVAKVASDCEKPNALVALSREQACARFAQAPPSLLPGIGPKTAGRLAAMGLTTLAALRGAAPERLAAVFGARAAGELLRRAAFEDDSAVIAVRETKSQSSETTFDRDVADLARLQRTLDELACSLCRRLRERGLRGRTVAIKVRLDDWTTITRARTLATITNDETTIVAVARELLLAYAPARPVRLLGVRLAGFDGEPQAIGDEPAVAQLRLGV